MVGYDKPKPKPADPKARILFILKERHGYDYSYSGMSSGLYNSAKFSSDMLAANGYVTKIVEVVDNNSIDKEVTAFKPDVVIIEALWVVPSKFAVLNALHPNVIWIVRIHSEAAFLAQEGIAIDWISQYPKYTNVYVAMNSQEAFSQAKDFYTDKLVNLNKLLYLPTYYPAPKNPYFNPTKPQQNLSVACMGAIRPLKNNLIQAIAAMRFADREGKILNFHVNNTRVESGGNSCYKNLVALFAGTKHNLIQHGWMDHTMFLQFLSYMDIGMQVSFSETFCIIAADIVSAGVPIAGSPAIRWLDEDSQADTITVEKITETLCQIYQNNGLIKDNLKKLQKYSKNAQAAWLAELKFLKF
jgi:hypothetical protein